MILGGADEDKISRKTFYRYWPLTSKAKASKCYSGEAGMMLVLRL